MILSKKHFIVMSCLEDSQQNGHPDLQEINSYKDVDEFIKYGLNRIALKFADVSSGGPPPVLSLVDLVLSADDDTYFDDSCTSLKDIARILLRKDTCDSFKLALTVVDEFGRTHFYYAGSTFFLS